MNNQDQHRRSTGELLEALDHLGARADISRLEAMLLLQQAGIRVAAVELGGALRLRRLRQQTTGGDDGAA